MISLYRYIFLKALKPIWLKLTEDQEQRLVNWLLTMSKIGYGVARHRIPMVVKDLLIEQRGMATWYQIQESSLITSQAKLGWQGSFPGILD